MRKDMKELKGKSKVDLQKEVASLRKTIAQDMIAQAASKPKDTNALSKKRRRLAVALTIIWQK